MKPNFKYEPERDSDKKQKKQEVVEFILDKDYGTVVTHTDLSKILGYSFNIEAERDKYLAMMNTIKRVLIDYGKILKSISGVGYYILKPSQVSNYCFRTYIKRSVKLNDKSKYILDRTDKSDLNKTRLEEIENMRELNETLINNMNDTIQESAYYSRKDYYDSLED